eukprot:GHVO01008062.1.p1 GENE.GHVO01008062.1~~GHVO01008062.1.p1  ORF type:complete len:113 (+),score=14.64 GHVO01008062.1:105-443(+)
MKLKAIGRHLLIKMESDAVEEMTKSGIALPPSYVEKLQGGCQVAVILDVGDCAFDDQPEVKLHAGDRVVTQKYPGSGLDVDPSWNDGEANKYRVILDTEVRAVVSEAGACLN